MRAGTSVLVGTDPARIVAESGRLIDDPAELARRSRLPNPFGDGAAAARIAAVLDEALH
ncbi:MAG: UDP-N-acetylglucosamine 2-epimerase [Verrucomicrobiota bacterium]